MHPVIRIAGLLALALGLATAGLAPLAGATALIAWLAWRDGRLRVVFLDTLRRLRWLFLSITILYAFLLPGDPLVPGWERVAPSLQGIGEGLLRCWMLWLMAGAARWLMSTTSRESLMGALYWLTRPLAVLGLDTPRFCLRLVLTLEYALMLRQDVARDRRGRTAGSYLQRAAQLARERLRRAESMAREATPGPVSIPLCGAPPAWQWSLPAVLLLALLLLSRIGWG